MAEAGHQLRNALRSLRRTPSVSLSAILCLALGIGATTAISSAVSHALLRKLPYANPERVVAVHRVTPASGPAGSWPHSAPNYHDLATQVRQISGLAALFPGNALVLAGTEAGRVPEVFVTGNLFSILGANAQAGRLISVDDDRPESGQVVVISDHLWRTQLGAAPDIVGKKLIVDGSPTTVIGVLPDAFEIQTANGVFRGDVWSPLRFSPDDLSQSKRNSNYLSVLGRLAPGATVESAQAELRTLFGAIITANPEFKGENIRVSSLTRDGTGNIRTPLLFLFGAVCMVLLIAASNVAALLLARGVERQRETAVRVALGGSRADVMRPVFVESLVLAAIGTTLGVILAAFGARAIGTLASARMPQLRGLSLDGRVLAFAIVLAVGVGILCAIVPAWRTSNVDPQDALRAGRGGGFGREHKASLRFLVITEIGLSLVLLISAGLVLKAFAGLVQSDPGFDPQPVLTMTATLLPAGYKNRPASASFMQPAAEAIAALPGVAAVGSINIPPYINWGSNFNIRYEGQPGDERSKLPIVENRVVTPGFFGVTKQRLLAGRSLQASDIASSISVVVANKALADRDFPGQQPANVIGKRFYSSDTSFATIVGIVSDIRNAGPFRPAVAEIYSTFEQGDPGATAFPILVRVAGGSPTSVVAGVRAAIRGVDPTAAISDIRTMPEVIERSLGQPKFYLYMLGTFAGVAVVLAVCGLYGMLSYTVVQRTRELGIRAALGSSRASLVQLVAAQGMRLVTAGLVIGLLGGWAATRLMTFMLFGVDPLDPVAWIGSAALLMVVGTAAAIIPATRAARVNPMLAIRNE